MSVVDERHTQDAMTAEKQLAGQVKKMSARVVELEGAVVKGKDAMANLYV